MRQKMSWYENLPVPFRQRMMSEKMSMGWKDLKFNIQRGLQNNISVTWQKQWAIFKIPDTRACPFNLLGTLRSTTVSSTKTSLQNITLQYRKVFAISPSRSCRTMWAKYPKHKLVRVRFQSKNREWNIHICKVVLSPKPQIWWFHVVLVQSTTKICVNMRAARAAWLFFPLLTNDIVLVNERVVDLKAWPNPRNISTQHLATLLGTTCCIRLATLLRYVAICWNMLGDVGSNLKTVKYFVQHFGYCMMLCSLGHVHATIGPSIREKISRGLLWPRLT